MRDSKDWAVEWERSLKVSHGSLKQAINVHLYRDYLGIVVE